MDWMSLGIGVGLVMLGSLVVRWRRGIADFTAESVRQEQHASHLLNRERVERDFVQPYTSAEGRRTSGRQAAAFGVFLLAAGAWMLLRAF